MIINATGPTLDSIVMAYNSITIQAEDSGLPPVVFCDVYIMGDYYKTISSTSPVFIFPGSSSIWEFDISGTLQEWLKSALPDIVNPFSLADPMLYDTYLGPGGYNPDKHGGAATVYCKIRSSTVDSYGVVTPDGPEPVQATVDTPAIAGVGYVIDSFLVINGAMQYSSDEILSSATATLRKWKRVGTVSTVFYFVAGGPTEDKIYPLSKIATSKIYAKEYAQFPIVIQKNGFKEPPVLPWSGSYVNFIWCTLAVECYDKNGVRIFASPAGPQYIAGESIYNIPVGLGNLSVLFAGLAAALPNTEYYQVLLWNNDWASVPGSNRMLFATPKYYLQEYKGDFVQRHVRLWFRNYYGHMEQLNFRVRDDKMDVKSTATERKRDNRTRVNHSNNRNNVRANTVLEIGDVFQESDMRLIEELLASSRVYIDTSADLELLASGQGQLLPVVVADDEIERRKWEDRYQYNVQMKLTMSHETTVVRG